MIALGLWLWLGKHDDDFKILKMKIGFIVLFIVLLFVYGLWEIVIIILTMMFFTKVGI